MVNPVRLRDPAPLEHARIAAPALRHHRMRIAIVAGQGNRMFNQSRDREGAEAGAGSCPPLPHGRGSDNEPNMRLPWWQGPRSLSELLSPGKIPILAPLDSQRRYQVPKLRLF